MNQDDESFLSAYIDGELAPDQQRRVESALDQNAQLAERMRALTQVRDLVAGLPHDRFVDVSARVMQRIAARPRRRGILPTLEGWRRGSRRILPLAGLAASAALLMVAASAAILLQASQLEGDGQTVAQVKYEPSDIRTNPQAPALAAGNGHAGVSVAAVVAPSTHESSADSPEKLITSPNALVLNAGSAREDAGAAGNSEHLPSGDVARLGPLLESPNLKRFFWIGNSSRNDSEQVAASIIERTTHFDYFKITVAHGIVIDPRHPGEATVMAFVVDPAQLERFNDQLKAALPGLVEQEAADAGIALQLADMEKVQSFPPASLGEVEIPREALALRTPAGPPSEKARVEQKALGDAGGSRGRRDAASSGNRESMRSNRLAVSPSGRGSVAANAGPPGGGDHGAAPSHKAGTSRTNEAVSSARSGSDGEQQAVVLVWVARPSAN